MQLSLEDVDHFFRLHRSLLFFVNQRLGVLDREVGTPEDYAKVPGDLRVAVHQALIDHQELIDDFVTENPLHLDEADLEIVRSWKHLVHGTFYAFRQLRNYMIFLTSEEPIRAYGVLALFDSFEEILGPDLPRLIKTTLLPFKGQIVYDGLMSGRNTTFGAGFRRGLDESYKEAKASDGIITSLPAPATERRPIERQPAPKKRAAARPTRGESTTPAASRPAHDRIVELIDTFCREHLDEEYATLCRKMAGILARKRPSPLVRGKPESWASGIVRVVGLANFLGDPSQPHHMKMTDIDEGFGVSEATGSAKASTIRKLLKIGPLNTEWTLPSRLEDNPLVWMIQVNGLIADVRHLPREIQEEAFRKGLIPYIPADRAGDPAED